MKSPCRCCGDPVRDSLKRWDCTLGFVCPECHESMNGRLGLMAMAIIEGAIQPEAIKEKK